MKKFTDESGWVRAAVCCAALLVHHGLRDTILTALPSLALAPPSPSPTLPPAPTPTSIGRIALPPVSSSPAAPLSFKYSSEISITPGNIKEGTVFKSGKTTSNNVSSGGNSVWTRSTTPDRDVFRDLSNSESTYSEHFSSEANEKIILSSYVAETKMHEAESAGEGLGVPVAASLGVFSHPQDSVAYKESSKGPPPKGQRNGKRQLSTLSPPFKLWSGGHARQVERFSTSKRVRRVASVVSPLDVSEVVSASKHDTSTSKDGREGLSAVPLAVAGGVVGVAKGVARDTSQYQPQYKDDWSILVEGIVVSAVYWLWLITAFTANPLLNRVGAGVVLGVSVAGAGVLGLFTHLASLGGPWPLFAFRIAQGAFQGVGYPAVVRVLEGVPQPSRTNMALLVLIGSYVGTSAGAGLGSVEAWYSGQYVMGSLAVLLTPLCLLLPTPDAAKHKDMAWASLLTCRGVWALVGVHAAHTWLLHTLILATPLALTHTTLYTPSLSGCGVAVVVLGVAVVAIQPLLPLSLLSLIDALPSALNRRRAPVVFGCILVTSATIVLATAGMDSVSVLLGVGSGLGGVGVGVTGAGVRVNMEDLAPQQLWRLVRLLDLVAVLIAALSPLPLTALAQSGDSGWVGVWLLPLAAVVPATAVYLFLLTTNQQLWDQTEAGDVGASGGGGEGGVVVNGVGPPRSVASRQSFKSARSTQTFKTAMSRPRTRTVSCRTVDDDLTDMYSAAGDEASVECRSVVEEPEPECLSVASSNSFKSDGADMHSVVEGGTEVGVHGHQVSSQQFGSMLVNGGATDRTQAWLSSHHHLDVASNLPPYKPEPQDKEEMKTWNAIYRLFW